MTAEENIKKLMNFKFDISQAIGAVHGTKPGDNTQNFEQVGSVTYIYGRFANGDPLTVQLAQQIPLTRGQFLGVTLHTKDFHVFGGKDELSLPMVR